MNSFITTNRQVPGPLARRYSHLAASGLTIDDVAMVLWSGCCIVVVPPWSTAPQISISLTLEPTKDGRHRSQYLIKVGEIENHLRYGIGRAYLVFKVMLENYKLAYKFKELQNTDALKVRSFEVPNGKNCCFYK